MNDDKNKMETNKSKAANHAYHIYLQAESESVSVHESFNEPRQDKRIGTFSSKEAALAFTGGTRTGTDIYFNGHLVDSNGDEYEDEEMYNQ
jgi:hypothetical protein